MSLLNGTQQVSGMIQPCLHQGTIIQNCQQRPSFLGKRKERIERLPNGNPQKKAFLTATSTPQDALLADIMYELAFRDPPSITDGGGSRGTCLQQSDVLVWTAFNNRVDDSKFPPQFVGLVDNSHKPELNGGLKSGQLPVAIRGTRSTYNTSWQTIHNGDMVYWDYPKTKDDQYAVVDRPQIDGVPHDKLLAITVGLPANYLSSLKIHSICLGTYDADDNATRARFRALKIPAFLSDLVEIAVWAGQAIRRGATNNRAVNAAGNDLTVEALTLFPDTRDAIATNAARGHALDIGQKCGMIIAELTHVLQARLKEHEIGKAMNMALSSRQLDIFIRG